MNNPTLLELLILALLATYRFTLLLKVGRPGEDEEFGPNEMLSRFRAWVGISYDEYSKPKAANWRAEALLCFLCLSVWIGIGVAVLIVATWVFGHVEIAVFLLLPFSLSGGAIYLKKAAG